MDIVVGALVGYSGIAFAAWLHWPERVHVQTVGMTIDADNVWGRIMRDLRDHGPSTSEQVADRLGGVSNLNRRMYDLKGPGLVREKGRIGNAKVWELAA